MYFSSKTDDPMSGPDVPVSLKEEFGGDARMMNGDINFNKTCRFCLTIPVPTKVENPLLTDDIANWYKTLTGIEVKDPMISQLDWME